MNETRARWIEAVEAAVEKLLATPVGELLDVEVTERALDELLSEDALTQGASPVARSSLLMEMAQLREDDAPAGTFVPPDARASIETLLAKKQLVPPELLREMLTHPAVEATLRDVLYGALKEFSEAVNPFFSEWGLLAILKKLSPFGLGPMQKSFEAAQKEFEKRLDPEIRKFLQGFSRRAVRKMADYAIERGDDPSFVAMRKELLSWTLQQPIRELVVVADDEALALGERAVVGIASFIAASPRGRSRRRATLEMIKMAHGKQTLDEALRVYGVTYRPNPAVLAEATWPLVAVALRNPVVRGFVEWLAEGRDEQGRDEEPKSSPT